MAEENEELDGLMLTDYKFFTPEHGAILLTGNITEQSAAILVDQLLFADTEDHQQITLFINSLGGDAYGTIMIADTIQMLETPVIGLVGGIAASGAFYVLQACQKRLMTRHSYLFWHQVITTPGDIASQLEMGKIAKRYEKLNEKFEQFLKERAKINATNWKKYFQSDNDIFFDATDALALNLIDEIIAPTKVTKKNAKMERK